MSESIINGVFALTGTFIGGLISYFIARNAKDFKTLKSQANIMANQIISYWNLERLYSEEMSKLINKPAKTILQEFREKIEEMNIDRPTMTEKEARKIITKNS